MSIKGSEGFVARQQAMLTRIRYVRAALATFQPSSVGTVDLCMEELEWLVEGLPEDAAQGMVAVDSDGNLKRS